MGAALEKETHAPTAPTTAPLLGLVYFRGDGQIACPSFGCSRCRQQQAGDIAVFCNLESWTADEVQRLSPITLSKFRQDAPPSRTARRMRF